MNPPKTLQQLGSFLASHKVGVKGGFVNNSDKNNNSGSTYTFDNKFLFPFLIKYGLVSEAPKQGNEGCEGE